MGPTACSSAAWNLSASARKPIFGLVSKTFSQPAVSVQMSSQVAGRIVTQAYLCRFILNRTTVHSMSATPASIWLEMPNSGHRMFTPPFGSITPI